MSTKSNKNLLTKNNLRLILNYMIPGDNYMPSFTKAVRLDSVIKSFDKNKTLDPEKLKDFFDTDFFQFSAPTISGDKENIYFLSK